MDITRLTGINRHPFRRQGSTPEDGTAVERLHRGLGIGGHVLRETVEAPVIQIPEFTPVPEDLSFAARSVIPALRASLAGQS